MLAFMINHVIHVNQFLIIDLLVYQNHQLVVLFHQLDLKFQQQQQHLLVNKQKKNQFYLDKFQICPYMFLIKMLMEH
jgi:hypothetical protein